MKRLVSLFLVLMMMLAVGAFAEQPAAEEVDYSVLKGKTVGFAQMDNNNSWRIAETKSMEDAAAKYGFNIIVTDAMADIAKQASDISDLIAQGIDFLVFPPQQVDGLQAAVKEAMDAGIPVILIDRTMNGTPGVDWTTEIMSDFYLEAQELAEYVIEHTGGKGNVVILQGTAGADYWSTAGLDPAAYADITWAHFLVGNLLPVTLGNIVGGGVMIGILYWTIFHHLAKEKAPRA